MFGDTGYEAWTYFDDLISNGARLLCPLEYFLDSNLYHVVDFLFCIFALFFIATIPCLVRLMWHLVFAIKDYLLECHGTKRLVVALTLFLLLGRSFYNL